MTKIRNVFVGTVVVFNVYCAFCLAPVVGSALGKLISTSIY